MKFGSLFTGVGGFDLGFERAGMECAWQVEVDKHCIEVLERHYPNVRRYEDVRKVGKCSCISGRQDGIPTRESIHPASTRGEQRRGSSADINRRDKNGKCEECGKENLEPVDLICGGFPCQDLSVAGKRAGLDGERSGLWFEFKRIIGELKPRWVVIENVPGLLSSAGGDDFAVILSGLAEFGYGVAWRVLDSQYFGVAQRRRRVFIVASLGNFSCGKVLFEQKSLSGNTEKGKETGEGIAAKTVSSLEKRGYKGLNADTLDHAIVGYRMTAFDETGGDAILASGDNIAQTLAGGSSKCHSDITSGQGDGNVVWEPRSADGVPRIHNKDLSPTLNTMQGGNLQPCVGVRRLTPTECCRLQGFPDDWNDNVSDTQRYKQMGNAVTVNVIEWIGRRIMQL